MTPSEKPPYWRLSSFYFFYFAFIGAYNSYFGLYLKSLEFSALFIGVMISMMQVMRIFAPYLWGALADRWGRRTPLIRMSVGMGLLCFIPFFFLRDFPPMLAVIAVLVGLVTVGTARTRRSSRISTHGREPGRKCLRLNEARWLDCWCLLLTLRPSDEAALVDMSQSSSR